MRTLRRPLALSSLGLSFCLAGQLRADPVERFRADQRGDFVMFGNTLGFECFPGDSETDPVPDPVLGFFDCSGAVQSTIDDSSPDLFWRSDWEDELGTARADASVTAADARSTAVLSIPAGASITYARIYWAGYLIAGSGEPAADTEIRIERPGAALDETIAADAADTEQGTVGSWIVEEADAEDSGYWYQSTADITELVAAAGPGAFRVSGVDTVELPTTNHQHPVASWTVVVFYELPGDTPRNLVIFDTLELVDADNDQDVIIRGFVVPEGQAGVSYDAKLGVLAYEGEERWPDDQLLFNTDPLFDAQNPAENFFNCSRSRLGEPVSILGDLPQLTGLPNSMAGVDMDVVDVTPQVAPLDTLASIKAVSDQDTFLLAAFVTSISTYQPDFVTSTKSLTDLNGDDWVRDDEAEYTITVVNTGNDNSAATVLTDPLPEGLSYVEDSIEVDGIAQTDRTGDDQAEYVADDHRIVVRLGEGASPTQGGSVLAGGSVVVTFRVRAEQLGTVSNQGVITAAGERFAPAKDFFTDADPEEPGAQPTVTEIVPPGDRDEDGLTDDREEEIGTDPDDADSDDDGVIDGSEEEPAEDTDDDDLINALDADSDDDGLLDGTETGADCSHEDTDPDECVPDADEGFTTTNPLDPDTDDGGVPDGVEDINLDGEVDDEEGNPTTGFGEDDDSDWDGLPDNREEGIGTDPFDADSDDDGLLDGDERDPDTDSDDDDLINALDADSDDDGLFDGTEMGRDCGDPDTDLEAGTCVPDADAGLTTTDPLAPDTDDGGVWDFTEDRNADGVVDDDETNPTQGFGYDDDTDWDGLPDRDEISIGTDPTDRDSDDDGLIDGDELEPGENADEDDLVNALDPDSDDDGLFDGTEMGQNCEDDDTDLDAEGCIPDADDGLTTTNPLATDTDGGGVDDRSEDRNADGAIDDGETDPTLGSGDDDDTDWDGLPDRDEIDIDTDPTDRDSDDDGVIDGDEVEPGEDADEDDLVNALDPDSDDDGLFDGTEMGRDCGDEDTDADEEACIPDGDRGLTTTNPLDADTDNGGVSDRDEDRNGDGTIDDGETNPTRGFGDDDDTDRDGLSDKDEAEFETDPTDRDSDDDGLIDGDELAPGEDDDDDGRVNALDADSDDDGLFDGTEMGRDCEDEGTDVDEEQCVADADEGASTTNPRVSDTDEGGVDDGDEDRNHNGRVDAGETEPKAGNGADDDTDRDGLPDAEEEDIGTDLRDRDSDDDGVLDGLEPEPGEDTDEDGKPNALDEDSDGDGLFDGTELGFACDDGDTNLDEEHCVADADEGRTTTDPLDADTDDGTVSDGEEDENLDGEIDDQERDPNDPSDDIRIVYPEGVVEGGGCSCSIPASRRSPGQAGFLLVLVGLVARRVRRRGMKD